ncbi:flagellar hook basal-body protein [Roseivivax sp. CAU 1753]
MDSAAYISLSRVSSLRRDLDVTANNIANADTVGFKRERVAFESYVHKGQGAGEDVHLVVDGGSYVDETQGRMLATGNPLDFALQGQGWFSFETADGQRAFGRDGRLTLDAESMLVNSEGAQIHDIGGAAITIPPELAQSLAVATDGTITTPDGAVVARLGVFQLDDLQSFERIGAGLFRPPAEVVADPRSDPNTDIIQGALEGSNVQAITEVTRLMEIQKSYDRAQNISQGVDDLRRDMLSRLSRPA